MLEGNFNQILRRKFKMEKIAKPLILEIEEAKHETSVAINDILQRHGLPCYLYEGIIEDIHKQISAAARNEIASVHSDYEKKCEEAKDKAEKKS